MKIAIDIRAGHNQNAGKGRYTYHLIKELLALDRTNEYVLYTNQITKELAEMTVPASRNLHVKLIDRPAWRWHFAVTKNIRCVSANVFFAPTSFIIPAFLPKEIPSVITVHDLVAFLYPHLHETKATVLEWLFFRRALNRTRHVLVPSENTKQDLMRLFRYPADKITVTPLGVDEEFKKQLSEIEEKRIREHYALPSEFILTVSGLEPRKNVSALVDVVVKNLQFPILIIVGGKGWKSAPLQKKICEAGERVVHIEKVSAHDLPTFYKLATVFVFPSLYEGFGLPPLEAMTAGCPVICSNASSLPEVVGDAALLFDPRSKIQLTEHLNALLDNEKLRQDLIERGKKQAARFSWKRTAEQTLDAILSLCQQ